MTKIIIITLIVTLVGLVVFQFIDPNSEVSIFKSKETSDDNTTTVDDDTTGSFTIDGYVVNPGTYLLSLDSPTMGELIDAAGGLNSNGDERCYYAEAEITDGESYYIPTKYDSSNICGDEVTDKININEDEFDSLITVSGIGTTLANSIISYRETNGLFYTLEALKNVSGIGNSKFSQIKDYIILHD